MTIHARYERRQVRIDSLLLGNLKFAGVKTKLFGIGILLLCSCTAPSLAQPSLERLGFGPPGGYLEESPEKKKQREIQEKINLSGDSVYRVSGSRVYNILADDRWKVVDGIAVSLSGGKLLAHRSFDGLESIQMICLTNAPPTANRTTIHVLAIRVGVEDIDGIPVEVWDIGKPYVPPPLTAQQIHQAERGVHEKVLAGERKAFENQSNAIAWLNSTVTNGLAGDQYSLALHYLNGQGCPTNIPLGIYWLKQSAAQGGEDAIAKLKTIRDP